MHILQYFMKFLKLFPVILANFHLKMAFFGHFSFFEDLALFKLFMAKCGLLFFFGPGKPEVKGLMFHKIKNFFNLAIIPELILVIH